MVVFIENSISVATQNNSNFWTCAAALTRVQREQCTTWAIDPNLGNSLIWRARSITPTQKAVSHPDGSHGTRHGINLIRTAGPPALWLRLKQTGSLDVDPSSFLQTSKDFFSLNYFSQFFIYFFLPASWHSLGLQQMQPCLISKSY